MFTRRKFLCGATALTLSTPLLMRALATEADAATNTILVLITMTGGNDGFNTVIPISSAAYGTYMDQRPSIGQSLSMIQQYNTAFDPTITTAPAQASTYAFHPLMGNTNVSATNNLRALYGKGKVAVLNGVGITPTAPLREDHFGAKEIWSVGDPNLFNVTYGWIGSSFDSLKLPNPSPFTLIAQGGGSKTLASATINQLSIGDLNGFSYQSNGSIAFNSSEQLMLDQTINAYALPTAGAAVARAQGQQVNELIGQVASYATAQTCSDYVTTFTPLGGSSQGCGLKFSLKQAARLILAGAPMRVYTCDAAGNLFDTHGSQEVGNAHGTLLQQVSEGITEFYNYLAAHNVSSNVLIMTTSDFGRRPYENSSAGTDHGSSSVHFMVGDPVKGGVYGSYPSLANNTLDSGGDALVPVDFRSYLAAGIQFLGADDANILPGGYASVASTLPGILR